MIYNCTIIDATTTTCITDASSSPMFFDGFSYDGILTNFWLGLIFFILLFKLWYDLFIGVKQKTRKYD